MEGGREMDIRNREEKTMQDKKQKEEEIILRAANLTLGYGAADIVKDVSLSIRRAEIAAIIGPNGSGKSTLLKALARLLPIRSGKITIGNADSSTCSSRSVKGCPSRTP